MKCFPISDVSEMTGMLRFDSKSVITPLSPPRHLFPSSLKLCPLPLVLGMLLRDCFPHEVPTGQDAELELSAELALDLLILGLLQLLNSLKLG
jgi:hypothetical protein